MLYKYCLYLLIFRCSLTGFHGVCTAQWLTAIEPVLVDTNQLVMESTKGKKKKYSGLSELYDLVRWAEIEKQN